MAWDFSTEPEFESKLEWMRSVRPARRSCRSRSSTSRPEQYRRAIRPAEGRGQGARSLGRAPRSGARWTGLRSGEARPDARDPRRVLLRAVRLREQRARLRQRRAHRDRRQRRTEGAVAVAAARRRHPLGLLDDRARRRRRPDDDQDARRARRRRVRDQRTQVVHVQRIHRRHPHRDGRDEPRRPSVPRHVDDRRPAEHAGRQRPPQHRHDG